MKTLDCDQTGLFGSVRAGPSRILLNRSEPIIFNSLNISFNLVSLHCTILIELNLHSFHIWIVASDVCDPIEWENAAPAQINIVR